MQTILRDYIAAHPYLVAPNGAYYMISLANGAVNSFDLTPMKDSPKFEPYDFDEWEILPEGVFRGPISYISFHGDGTLLLNGDHVCRLSQHNPSYKTAELYTYVESYVTPAEDGIYDLCKPTGKSEEPLLVPLKFHLDGKSRGVIEDTMRMVSDNPSLRLVEADVDIPIIPDANCPFGSSVTLHIDTVKADKNKVYLLGRTSDGRQFRIDYGKCAENYYWTLIL